MDTVKDRNGMDLTEAEHIKKRWQEYTEELYKKHINDPDNHNGVITHPEPDILEGYKVKVQCCKEQYCIGTWNVRSMNQGKLEVITQEMARVNIDILGIGELKWTRMGEFNSDDHYIYYCGQDPLEEME